MKDLNYPEFSDLEERNKNHQLWLRWDKKSSRWNFQTTDFTEVDYEPFTDTETLKFRHIFEWEILDEANFQGSNIKWLSFKWASLKWTDFRNASFDFSQFNEKQKKEAIFTDKDLEKYNLRKEIEKDNLEYENAELKEENKENEETLDNISNEKTTNLLKWFNDITNTFLNEEKNWLIISFISFLITLLVSIVLVIDLFLPQYTSVFLISIFWIIFFIIFFILFIFAYADIQNQKNKNPTKSKKLVKENKTRKYTLFIWKYWIILLLFIIFIWVTTNIQNFYSSIIEESSKSLFTTRDSLTRLLPISIALISFLYFSLYQYWKAKGLRIENQNKIAILYWFEAIKSDTTPNMDKWRFYDKIAEVVFTKIFQSKKKEIGLPLDQVTKLATEIASVIVKNK